MDLSLSTSSVPPLMGQVAAKEAHTPAAAPAAQSAVPRSMQVAAQLANQVILSMNSHITVQRVMCIYVARSCIVPTTRQKNDREEKNVGVFIQRVKKTEAAGQQTQSRS